MAKKPTELDRRLIEIEKSVRKAWLYQIFCRAFPKPKYRHIGDICNDDEGRGLPGRPGMLPSEQMFGRVKPNGRR